MSPLRTQANEDLILDLNFYLEKIFVLYENLKDKLSFAEKVTRKQLGLGGRLLGEMSSWLRSVLSYIKGIPARKNLYLGIFTDRKFLWRNCMHF
jgi:hypothetical protein